MSHQTKCVFDLETDGLLPDVSRIWCLGFNELDANGTTVEEEDATKDTLCTMLQSDVLIGHNIIGYDLPVIKKVYGFAPKQGAKIVDTLILSRLLCRGRTSHSLSSWGETFKFPKGDHSDWTKYTPEMGAYCKQDVDITVKLYNYLMEKSQ